MTFESSFIQYALRPEDYWPSTRHRNVKKLQTFLARGSAQRGEKPRKYVENIARLAHLRSAFKPKHLYLLNAGSSGSHWLEAMLGLLPGFYNGGEIYFPQRVKDVLKSFDRRQANLLLDAVYLLHTGAIYRDALDAVISNSAHLADHEQISRYSQNKVVVFLQRNPVDVVMSRTFRKDEYKQDIAPDLTAEVYLEKNCEFIEKFYGSLNFASFDMVVKYEDLLASPKTKLELLIGLLELEVSDADIDDAILKTSKDEERKSMVKRGATITNVYLGERKDEEWAKCYARERLNSIMVEYGYC